MLKIQLETGQKMFVTSDTHAFHTNICRGVSKWDLARMDSSTTRDFKTLEDMNDAIVNGINNAVGQDDILLHLGDWSFGGFDNIRIFRDRLVCKNIHLVTGNHDHHIERNKENIRDIFTSVSESYTELELKFRSIHNPGGFETKEFVLSHYPIASWNKMNDGRIHLFGHVHLPPHKKIMQGRSMDVGVDGNSYKPYNIFECVTLLKHRPIRSTALPSDHHVVETNEK